MASQLESGELSYGPGEPIAVPEEVERKLEIKPTGVKLDLEIKWSAKGESHEAERSDDRESPREADTIASGS